MLNARRRNRKEADKLQNVVDEDLAIPMQAL